MSNIIRHFSNTGIFIRFNAADVQGHQISPQGTVRILIFEQTRAELSIDFIGQQLGADWMYIIPSLHFYYLNADTNFYCIDIDPQRLNGRLRQLLYRIKYRPQKNLPVSIGVSDCGRFKEMAGMLQAENRSDELILKSLAKWIGNRLAVFLPVGSIKYTPLAVQAAEKLLGVLSERALTLQNCGISTLAEELCCSARQLHRICNDVFGLCAKDVVKMHIVAKAIYLLQNEYKSVKDVANELGFSGIIAFSRYLKANVGYSPTVIRTLLESRWL